MALWCMFQPKGVDIVSAQLSDQLQRAEKLQFLPPLALMVRKEASKVPKEVRRMRKKHKNNLEC